MRLFIFAKKPPAGWTTIPLEKIPTTGIPPSQIPLLDACTFKTPAYTRFTNSSCPHQKYNTRDTPPPPSDQFKKDARDACVNAIDPTTCPYVDAAAFIEGCTNDAILTFSLDIVESHRLSFAQTCQLATANHEVNTGVAAAEQEAAILARRGNNNNKNNKNKKKGTKKSHPVTDLRSQSKYVPKKAKGKIHGKDGTEVDLEDVKKRAEKIKKENGYGHNTCPRDCNGRGTCTPMGCACQPPYTGPSCNRDLNQISKKHGRGDVKGGKHVAPRDDESLERDEGKRQRRSFDGEL
ncbi:hypothetical protein BDR26DRAFT_559469 [Obelidium mucronatum]|nr:hypothetical protein BDR26DRAFT_559469 [Obelidium mucronatum]